MADKDNIKVVAAIDFGTTGTGYALWNKDTDRKFIQNIQTKQGWTNSPDVGLQAPTTVLMDKEGKFLGFGFEAESQYHALAIRGEHTKCRYFRHFKMKLHHEENLHRRMLLKDVNGFEMEAFVIFREAIRYVKNHVLKKVKDSTDYAISVKEIKWVLTVPAIWRESAKQFMREAAADAGIPTDNLLLALEPEAAAVYCKELAVLRADGVDGAFLRAFDPGEKYIIVDMGGGTVDVSIHDIMEDGSIREIHKPTGGPWGGQVVNQGFAKYMETLVTPPVFEEYRKKYEKEWIEIQSKFEGFKRGYIHGSPDPDFDMTHLGDVYKKVTKKRLADRVKSEEYARDVQLFEQTLCLKPSLMEGFFETAIVPLTNHIEDLLHLPIFKTRSVSTILLVGGNAEQKLVSDRIKRRFDKKQIKVLIPNSAGSAVLKGAVMYGIDPRVISSRISPYTYGLHTRHLFNARRHPSARTKKVNGKYVVDNAFCKLVECGENVYVGEKSLAHNFRVVNMKTKEVYWKVYQSVKKDPIFCDDEGCKPIGKLSVIIPETCVKDSILLKLTMTCRGTELEVKAEAPEQKIEVDARFDFLWNYVSGSEEAEAEFSPPDL